MYLFICLSIYVCICMRVCVCIYVLCVCMFVCACLCVNLHDFNSRRVKDSTISSVVEVCRGKEEQVWASGRPVSVGIITVASWSESAQGRGGACERHRRHLEVAVWPSKRS